MGILSCGGISFAISIALDALAFSTFHIFICYAISGAVYQRMLKTFGSLWNLFRGTFPFLPSTYNIFINDRPAGKRYNVLRNRTDSWDYDLDQLLFGTILFTLLAFLFPTVLVYYALFAVVRAIVSFLNPHQRRLAFFYVAPFRCPCNASRT
jgi:phosphatidylinositol glycan class Q protein